MKRYIILLILSILIVSGTTNVMASSAEDGKKIFDEKCSGCHEGKSYVPSISKISALSEKDITNKVRNGVQGTLMRAFSTDELSDSDLNNIIAYVKNSSSNTSSNKTGGFDIYTVILCIFFIYIIFSGTKSK